MTGQGGAPGGKKGRVVSGEKSSLCRLEGERRGEGHGRWEVDSFDGPERRKTVYFLGLFFSLRAVGKIKGKFLK